VLNLWDNNISDAGAAALAGALKVVLGAQIVIFRQNTCFLLQLLSFHQPFRRYTQANHFVVLTNVPRQSSMCFEPG
jgi:hypothetical protein